MQNIEFKAELRNMDAAREQCRLLGAERLGVLQQKDTYFRLTDGRLKRRECPHQPTEWIFYHRGDRVTPRMSNFTILTDLQARRRWGTASLREWLIVNKTRELWMLDNVRIHLDEVEGLGQYIEFEAVISKLHDVQECHMVIAHLREAFAPVLGEPLAVSYSDLLDQVVAERG
ncbi:MAG TPA: class IV adenylate cyclase [Phycisphaerales bacterium]|nr:class IV adenylate cyclase [Phycisphaerales bacterium]